jgi:hypothetical protein
MLIPDMNETAYDSFSRIGYGNWLAETHLWWGWKP